MKHIDVLKVSRETKPAAFAGLIYHIFASDDTTTVKTRSFGMEASHNMFKGIEKAQGFLDSVDLILYSRFNITYEHLKGNADVITVYTMDLSVRNK
jgi:stage V sporulation protein SpoVS